MASHHQVSPSSAMHSRHGPPPHLQHQQQQQNGHAAMQGQHRAAAAPAAIPQPVTPDQINQINEGVWLQIGRAAEAMQNNRIALEAFQKVLSYNQWSTDALQSISSILRAEDRFQEAAEYLNQIIKLQPHNGDSWSSLGHCYLMMDELQQAYAAYQSALYNLRDPKEPKLWYGIGILYDRYGSLDHAEEAFSQVMRMDPHFEKANEIYFRLGIIYKQQCKYNESLECFRYIVSNPPQPLNQTDIWFQIGHVYEQQKELEQAKQAYHRVLERDPHHAKVLQQLGWLYHQQSNDYQTQEQAIDYLEKSVGADQTDAQSWYLLGRCYMSQLKFPKAYEAYQQAVYRDGRNPTFWCSIGVLYYQINQYRDALDAYSRAIRLNPNISEVWYDLGTLYESCNNQTNDALDAYQRAAELDPNNQSIRTRLQLLRNGHSSGGASQNGAPAPQDVPPQAYQPTAVNGPSQNPWGTAAHAPSSAPAPAPGPAPAHSQHQPAPPPIGVSRGWEHRGGETHPSQPPAQAQPVSSYDHREGPRPHQPARQPSPRPDHMRHQESRQRQVSPSPRAHHSVPSLYRPGQSVQQAPPPHAPMQAAQQQPPPNRITNPNYGGQHAPQTSTTMPTPGTQHNALPPYARVSSPPTSEVRPIVDGNPPSPRSAYRHQQPQQALPPHHQGQPQYHHHADPSGPSNIASGAPAPSSALAAQEAASRERQEREKHSSSATPKRHREWEEREDHTSAYKRNATEENRARLDDPNGGRRVTTPPSTERDKAEREGRGSNGPAYPSSTSGMTSPGTRRAEEVRRADENYRPSAVAHQPAPLSTVLHQEGQRLPPITAPNEPASPQKQEEGATKMEIDEASPASKLAAPEEHAASKAEAPAPPPAPPPRAEEPAARKMDIDDNYDDSAEEDAGKKAGAEGSGPASASRSWQGSPKAGSATSQPAATSAPPEGAKVEAGA